MIFVKEMTVLKRVCDRKEEQVENIATFFFLLTSLRRWDDQRWWWRYMRKLFLLIIYITWCAVFHVGCGTRFTWRTAQCLHDNLYSTKDYLTIPLLPLTFNGCRQLACTEQMFRTYTISCHYQNLLKSQMRAKNYIQNYRIGWSCSQRGKGDGI